MEGETAFDVWLTVDYTDGAAPFSMGLTEDEYNAIREQHPQLALSALSDGAVGSSYSYTPSKTGNTLGKIVGQPPAGSVSARNANPAVTPETDEEKSFWDKAGEWFSEQGENIGEALTHPVEGVKGAAKGLWNMVPDMGTMLAQGNTYQTAGEMEQSAALMRLFDQSQQAEKMTGLAQDIREHAGEVNFNNYRLEMSNKAQEGGDLIATMASMVTPAGWGKGILKTGKRVVKSGGKVRARGVVQSRINIANGQTRFTPTRKTGEPVSAGFDHVLEGHFNRPLANSRSIFSVSPDRLKQILQSPSVVKTPVVEIPGGQFKRVVNTGEVIGNTALKHGGNPTSWIEIYTDKAGNLITTYPIPKP